MRSLTELFLTDDELKVLRLIKRAIFEPFSYSRKQERMALPSPKDVEQSGSLPHTCQTISGKETVESYAPDKNVEQKRY